MTRVLVQSGLVLLLVFAAFAPIQATAPAVVSVYFDRALTKHYADCPDAPPGTVLDTVFVAVDGLSAPLEGIEYRILFPPEVVWLAEIGSERGLRLGTSDNGISIAFFTPVEGPGPVIVQELLILWLCDGCETTNIPITVEAHPSTSALRGVTSDLVFEDFIGYTSYVCGTCLGCSPERASAGFTAVTAGNTSAQCVLDCPLGDGGVILPGELPGEHHTPDLDGDGMVSIMDFAAFGTTYPVAFDPAMDFYCSGSLDLIDFVLFTRHWLHTGTIPVESRTWGHSKAQFAE